jgi:hypothetical protein
MNCKIDTTPDITLVTIYDKSDQASISNRELRKLMKKNGLE